MLIGQHLEHINNSKCNVSDDLYCFARSIDLARSDIQRRGDRRSVRAAYTVAELAELVGGRTYLIKPDWRHHTSGLARLGLCLHRYRNDCSLRGMVCSTDATLLVGLYSSRHSHSRLISLLLFITLRFVPAS